MTVEMDQESHLPVHDSMVGAGVSWPAKIMNMLFWWQDDHCQSAYESERDGRQLPPELR